MSKPLEDRLTAAKREFAQAEAAVTTHASKIPSDLRDEFRNVITLATEIDRSLDLIQTRLAARQLLEGLEDDADADGLVQLGTRRAKYQHVRMIGVQAYLASEWALADRIAGLVGRLFCTPAAGFDASRPAQLVAQFVQEDGRRRNTAGALWESVRQTFGWPIAISYALRNHVFHDGAYSTNQEFFEGPTAASAFMISTIGWTRLEQKARTYGVLPSHHRAGAAWPAAPRDDLRAILDVCEREVDDALGVLIASACRTFAVHIGCIVGDD